MQQEKRSERSRAQVLEGALRLFSTQGYRGTSMRDIAVAAGVCTGNVYHQFPDKETIFRTLLDEYWEAIASRISRSTRPWPRERSPTTWRRWATPRARASRSTAGMWR